MPDNPFINSVVASDRGTIWHLKGRGWLQQASCQIGVNRLTHLLVPDEAAVRDVRRALAMLRHAEGTQKHAD